MQEKYRMLYEAYRKAWEDGAGTHDEAVRMAVGSRLPCYWLSESEAWRQIRRMMRGQPPSYRPGGRKRASIEEIFGIFRLCRDSGAYSSMSDRDLVSHIVNSGGNGDFLSYGRARKIIGIIRKERRNGNGGVRGT